MTPEQAQATPHLALHHLALGARDVERVAEFYRLAFGLEEVTRHHSADALRSIWLDMGGALLMIEHTHLGPRDDATGVLSGPFLLAFRVSPAERESVERRLAELGAAVESRTAHSSYFRDPEGNRVAVSHYPDPAATP